MPLLSTKAIDWLCSINFDAKTHGERLKLIEAARIAYPNVEDDEPREVRLNRFRSLINNIHI